LQGKYERELQDDVLRANGIFGRRSSGSLVIDVTALYGGKGVIFEVKSSKDKTVYLSGKRLKEQFEKYGDLKTEYKVPILYAFRWKSGKHWDKINNWRIFKYNEIEHTKQGNPVLRWENGIDMKKWIKDFKNGNSDALK